MEHLNNQINKEFSSLSPFKKELEKKYKELMAEKAQIEAQLADLKELVIEKAPELLTIRKSLKWDYKPGIHRLPQDYFKLDTGKVSAVFNSAAGGAKFLQKYGHSFKETVSYSWKPLKKEDN